MLAYTLLPQSVHPKLHLHLVNERLTYAHATRYANERLPGRVVVIQTSDVSVSGDNWDSLTPRSMRGNLFALSRHELPSCGKTCDCLSMFDGCHDAFVFVPPLQGGEQMLEQISFRLGGLWGSENRYLYEVLKNNPALKATNPCKSLRMNHLHCEGTKAFRPNQDQRRVNLDGKSKQAKPCFL